MISLSHWGMFGPELTTVNIRMPPKGFKFIGAISEFNKPNAIIEIVPLAKGEPQPVYVAPDWDCA